MAVLIVVAVVVGVAWYRMGASSTGTTQASRSTGARVSVTTPATSAPVRASTAGSLAPSGSGSPATSSKGRTVGVVVHVAGAVVHPGVVELPLGSRVIDAIEAVGGALANADLDRLNLAAKLIDGQRIAVSRVGDPAAPAASASATGNATTDGGLVDLNNATQAQLEALPGVGPQLAMAIIAERDRRGGFRSVNELRTVHGIGDKRFADLRPRVTV